MNAPATVTPLHSIDDAWNRYCALVQAQRDDERLLTDRDFQESLARAWEAVRVRGGFKGWENPQ